MPRATRFMRTARIHVKTGVLLFGAVFVLLLTWVVGMPRYSQPDEHAHMIKMYATSHWQGAGSRIPGAPDVLRTMTAPASLVSGTADCYAFRPETTAGCAVPNANETPIAATTWVGSYPPWYYAIVGFPVRFFGRDTSVLAGRALSALLCSLLLAVGLSMFRKSCEQRAALALVVLTPMTLSLGAAVNPSGFEICGAFLFWSVLTFIALDQRPLRRLTRTWAGVVAATVVLVRPLALPWMLAGFAAIGIVEWHQFSDRRKQMQLWAPAVVTLLGAVIASGLWGLHADTPLSDSRFHIDASVGSMIRISLGRTVLIGRSAFGVLGWLDTELPSLALLLWLASVGVIAVVAWLAGPSRVRTVLLGLALLWVCLPVVYTTAVGTPAIWTGRYSLPVLGGLAFVAMLVRPGALGVAVMYRVARFVGLAFVVIEVVSFHQALRRFMVGASGSIALRSPGWHPPVNAWLLVLANAAAAAAVVAMMLRPYDPGPSHEREPDPPKPTLPRLLRSEATAAAHLR